MVLDPIVSVISALVLSYVFVLAGLHKWQNLREFRATLENYQLLPDFLVHPVSYFMPVLEIVAGVCMLVPLTSRPAALVAGLLLIIYIVAISINLLRGRRNIDCGCLGPLQRQTLSEWLVVRNGLLLGLVLCVMGNTAQRGFDWFDWLVVVLATVTGCLFYNIGNQLLVNKDKLKLLRLDNG